jgi:hypothetical protein
LIDLARPLSLPIAAGSYPSYSSRGGVIEGVQSRGATLVVAVHRDDLDAFAVARLVRLRPKVHNPPLLRGTEVHDRSSTSGYDAGGPALAGTVGMVPVRTNLQRHFERPEPDARHHQRRRRCSAGSKPPDPTRT